MDLKLKDLRYLVAVADLRHFGRAAARCFVSQPTLSAQLKKLEQSLALPRLELRLYEYQTAPMLERLRGGELDVGILALPVELDGLESHELYREAFVVALPERHPLAAHETLRVADLKGETLLLLEDGHC